MNKLNYCLVAGALGVGLAANVACAAPDAQGAHCVYTHFATFPVKFSDMSYTLDGNVNGKPAVMLVDTGSSFTALTRHAAEKAGLKLGHTDLVTVGVGGESAHYQAKVDDISFGKLHWRNANLGVIWDGQALDSFDALVGADILFTHDIEFSTAESEIRFFEPKDCKETFLAYWDDNAGYVAMDEMAPSDDRRMFEVQVNGKKFRAIIDSGAPTSVIDLKAAAKVGVTPSSPGTTELATAGGIGKHETKTWRAPFTSFTIGEETIKNPRIRIKDLYGSAQSDSNTIATSEFVHDQPDMLLGADFLRAHRVLFAVSQRRLYYSYVGGKVFGVAGE